MEKTEKPAILGGKAVFQNNLPIVKPPIGPHLKEILMNFKQILKSGMITSSDYVQKLERAVESYVGVKHCVATASCTSGLMLTLKALNIKNGEVLIPSLMFPGTAHAIQWNNLKMRLVDCNAKTYNIDVADLQEKITGNSKAIVPVHIFGNPCDAKAIDEIADDHSLIVIYDSAHAFGAKYRGTKVGQFGGAEVFSGSPSKTFTTVEGGLVTTTNDEIAKKVEMGRNYGCRGDYNCEMPGLSARMSEFHASLGLTLLPHVDSEVKKRNKIAEEYKKGLSKLTGIKFQEITSDSSSSYTHFGILVDDNKFGLNRDELAVSLEKENIMTRKYFYPPIHMQKCYPELKTEGVVLPNTKLVSYNVLCLPMFSELTFEQIHSVVEAVARIHNYAEEIKVALHR